MPSKYKYPSDFESATKGNGFNAQAMSDVNSASLYREGLEKRLLGKSPDEPFKNSESVPSESGKKHNLLSKVMKLANDNRLFG